MWKEAGSRKGSGLVRTCRPHTDIGCERVNGTRAGFEQRGGKGGWPDGGTLRGLWCLREMGLGNQEKRWHSQDGESGQKFWEEFSGWANKPW